MSRIGKKPIVLPKGVTAQISDGAVDVKGPKGQLRQPLPPGIAFELADGQLHAKTVREDKDLGKFHGLGRIAGRQRGARRDGGLQEGARHRRRRLPC